MPRGRESRCGTTDLDAGGGSGLNEPAGALATPVGLCEAVGRGTATWAETEEIAMGTQTDASRPGRARKVSLFRIVPGLVRDPLGALEHVARTSRGRVTRINLGLF